MRSTLVILFFIATSSCFSQQCFPQLQDKIQDYIDTSYYSSKANFFQSIERNVYLATSSVIVDRTYFDIPFDYEFTAGSNFCKSELRVELVVDKTTAYTRDYTPGEYRNIFWTNFSKLYNHLVIRIDLTDLQYQSLFADYSDESAVNYAEKKYKLYIYEITNEGNVLIYGDKPLDISFKFSRYEY
jgi:hypothetical protein